MKRILILVEGQTEETFVRDVLKPALETKKIHPIAKIIATKVVKHGTNFKGGLSSYTKVKSELLRLFKDTNAALISTMLDYYGLPSDFPGKSSPKGANCYEKVQYLEDQFQLDLRESRFIPYLQLHEFESILFSSIDALTTIPELKPKKRALESIRQQFSSPEEINENPQTCPSQRLLKLFPSYKKALYGTLVSGRIGINIIRQECRHFDEWLKKIEAA